MRLEVCLIFLVVLVSCSSKEHLNPRDNFFNDKFNDVQSRQLSTAKKLGIRPQSTRKEIDAHSKLIEVKSAKGIKIAQLTHSSPNVLPQTKELIETIGNAFIDSLKIRKLPKERVVVTSLTRSKQDQQKLSKGNINAVPQSAHFYGTTFDISYIRFSNNLNAKRDVLANVLEDLRKEKQCWVKYEIQQKCFHITVR